MLDTEFTSKEDAQDTPEKIAVLGSGSYGTALAIAFSRVMPVVL